jgi:hypothetical protein
MYLLIVYHKSGDKASKKVENIEKLEKFNFLTNRSAK